MHMYDARKNVRENRAITHILKGEMRFATETSLARSSDLVAGGIVIAKPGIGTSNILLQPRK
jgi:hypothetical protein